jgi:hypothetical protein
MAMLAASTTSGVTPIALLSLTRTRLPPLDTRTTWRSVASRHWAGANSSWDWGTICAVPQVATQCSPAPSPLDGEAPVPAQPARERAASAAATAAGIEVRVIVSPLWWCAERFDDSARFLHTHLCLRNHSRLEKY